MTTRMYRHTQFGYLTLASFGTTVIGTVVMATVSHRPVFYWILVPLFIVGLIFSSLTIEVDHRELRSHFGPGVWRKRYDLATIASVECSRSHWFEGWGIRATGKGMLYNVSGTKAVAVRLQNGAHFRLGTDEPRALLAALRENMETGNA